jgi:DNA-directed RNA polymerase subunit H (RpoH/RPB5)
MFFLYTYVNDVILVDDTKEKEVFSQEEKLEILEGLAGDPEDIPSIEERRVILEGISDNKSEDAGKYSKEEKLQILKSLQ